MDCYDDATGYDYNGYLPSMHLINSKFDVFSDLILTDSYLRSFDETIMKF